MNQTIYRQGIRKRSKLTILGLPFIDIALGPDFEKGEIRGHARGIIAIGDVAGGWFALGGVSMGLICFGGLSIGVITIGGLSLGLIALGGFSIGMFSMGGLAVGGIAIGGGAFGYYAFGGGAYGKNIVSATKRLPEAVEFFKYWFPFLPIE